MKNIIILGIVYNPIMNQLFTAQIGKGAYLNNERIHVSNTKGIYFKFNKIENQRFMHSEQIINIIIT